MTQKSLLRLLNKASSISRRAYSKLSYRHHIGEEPLRALTIGQLLEETATKYPDRYSVISKHQNRKITFRDALEEADKLAAGLRKLGFQKGDRFGLWAPNLIEWYITKLACARSGLIMVAINPAYEPKEMKYCINKVGIKGIICPHETKAQNFYENLATVAPELRECEPGKLKSPAIPSLEKVIVIADNAPKGSLLYDEVMNYASVEEIKHIKKSQFKIQPDDAFNIQFTSGTTGLPKAAVISHFNIVNNANFIGRRNELHRKHHTICVQVPFFHAYGLVIAIGATLYHGATMVLPAMMYSPNASLTAIKEDKCTLIYGTPTMYVDLVNKQLERNEDISPEIALCGGSPCPPHLFKKMREVLRVKQVKSVYGLTETTASAFQSMSEDDDEYKCTSTVGHLQDHLEAKVVDSDNNIVPFGSPGELCLRGYATMLGYWDDEAKTKEMIGPDGWLRTGDQFVLHEDGYGVIVGRLKEMIIRGGENIFPKEIEDFLVTHEDIVEVYVIGLPHERLGEEVCACIRTRENVSLSYEDIRQYCKGKLASFKIPSKVELMTEFPKTTSGKIKKYELVRIVVNKYKK